MGTLLKTSNQLVDNTMTMLDNMMNSPFNKFLNETSLPVEYYNINDLYSTTDSGLGTIDQQKGEDSPTRFNKIKDYPLYGLKQLIPEMSELEGDLIDLSIEGEVTALPNTIKPSPGDYFIYRFLGRSIVFQINDVVFTTIQSNSYYKLAISMKSIDDDTYDKELDKQVVETFVTDLETVGTNVKCIIKSTVAVKVDKITDIVDSIKESYIDTFYHERYNSIVFRDGEVLEVNLYDQFLTNFIQTNLILKNTRCTVLINYDNKNNFRSRYNKTFFRNIETRSTKGLSTLFYAPTSFPTSRNPFVFYGEEVFFCLDIYEDAHTRNRKNEYFSSDLISAILNNVVTSSTELLDAIIIRYLNCKDDSAILDVITDDELNMLDSIIIEYSRDYLYKIPIVLYILDQHATFLKHN